MCTLFNSLLYSVNKNVSIPIFHPEPARSVTCFLPAIRVHRLHCPIRILATLEGREIGDQSESILSVQGQFLYSYLVLFCVKLLLPIGKVDGTVAIG